jgi:hypothetical protein
MPNKKPEDAYIADYIEAMERSRDSSVGIVTG